MYRVSKDYDESSSDDEGPSLRKEQKLDSTDETMKNSKAGSKAAQMWTDLLAEQSLSETFSDKVGVYRGENDMVERGVESYVLPDARCTNNEQEPEYQKNHSISPAADDSGPFDFVADEGKVEKFSDRYEKCPHGCGNESRGRSRQGPRSFSNQEKNTGESWRRSTSTSRSISRESRKRRRNNYIRNKKGGDRIAGRVGNMNNSLKRRRSGKNPSSLPSDDYSLEALLATEFPDNISIDELAERIVMALGERNGKFLQSVILEVGEEKALELFEATREIEASGGMMIADGTRRRTPGGVFMTLFKTDPDVLPILKEKVHDLQKATAREIRTARRRGKRETSKDAALGKIEMLKKLSSASEILLETQSVKENPL
ncbi:PHAX RNA-binding domain family protein [Acanthocheilonema viteae]